MFLLLYFQIVFSADYYPSEADFPVIQNQGWTSILNKTFARLPPSAASKVRPSLYSCSLNTPGFVVSFKTNSSAVIPHLAFDKTQRFDKISIMPETAISNCDIYFKHPDTGKWTNAIEGKIELYSGQILEYRVYLPGFVPITSFYISVNDGSSFEWIPKDDSKPIVVYGGSIVQGVVTTRPTSGAWPTCLQMHMNIPVLNFGFINNGKLEKAIIDIIAEGNDARIFIIDCLPDLSRFNSVKIKQLIRRCVSIIRGYRPTTPILFLDHIGFADMDMIKEFKHTCNRLNQANQEIIDEIRQTDSNVYRLPREDMGMTIDCWGDSSHPNSLGHRILAVKVEQKIHEILNE